MPLVLLLVSQKKPSSSDDPEFESGGAQQRRKPAPSYLDTEEFLSFAVPAPRLSLQPRRLGRAAAQAWLSWGIEGDRRARTLQWGRVWGSTCPKLQQHGMHLPEAFSSQQGRLRFPLLLHSDY